MHRDACGWGLGGLITFPTAKWHSFPHPAFVGVNAEMPGPATPNAPHAPHVCVWHGKESRLCDTHFISSESCPQGKLLIPLQEADFHVVDFVPVEHHQHVGFGPGPRGAVSDQESAILKHRGRTVIAPGMPASHPGLVAMAMLACVRVPHRFCVANPFFIQRDSVFTACQYA